MPVVNVLFAFQDIFIYHQVDAHNVTLHAQLALLVQLIAYHVLLQPLEHIILEVSHALVMLVIILSLLFLLILFVNLVNIHVPHALVPPHVQLAILIPHYVPLDVLKELWKLQVQEYVTALMAITILITFKIVEVIIYSIFFLVCHYSC